jgi:hypothetical protein
MIPLLVSIALPLQALATESSEQYRPDTLVHGSIESNGYGAPVVKYSSVGNSDGLLVGGRGGWVINHSFVLGGAGYGLATNYQLPSDRLTFGYGGVMLEYITEPESLVHLSFDTVIGGGGVGTKGGGTSNSVFVLEPEIDAILNISASVHAGLGVAYRMTRGVHLAGLSNSDLSGVNGTFMVQFGGF